MKPSLSGTLEEALLHWKWCGGRDVELFSVGCGVQETTHPLPLTSWDACLLAAQSTCLLPFWSLPLPGDRLVLAVLTRTCPIWEEMLGHKIGLAIR